MKMFVELDIAYLEAIVMSALQRQFPDTDITGFSVKSHNTPIVHVTPGLMHYPSRHRILQERATIDWSNNDG